MCCVFRIAAMSNKKNTNTGRADSAQKRCNVYGFFARIFRSEISKDILKNIKETGLLAVLIDMGAEFDDDFLHVSDSKLIDDLAIEYARLFIGPGNHISPHESVFHERPDGDWGSLWGADTVAVKKFIESTGLYYKPEFKDLPDHISVELEFMMTLTAREALAWNENDREGAIYCKKIQKKFLKNHICRWVPIFCDKVIGAAELSFYREIAKVTKDFLVFEAKELGLC